MLHIGRYSPKLRRRLLIAVPAAAVLIVIGAWLLRPSESVADRPRATTAPHLQAPVELPPPLTYTPELRQGEVLEYEMRWSGLPAGRASFTVHWLESVDQAQAWLVRARARSNRLVSEFYPIDSDTRSLIDTIGGFSRHFQRDQKEGALERQAQVHFDYRTREAVVSSLAQSPFGAVPEQRQRLNGPAQDPLSALYALRALSLPDDGTVTMRVYDSGREWPLLLKVEDRDRVDLGRLGQFEARRVRCRYAFPGLFVRRGDVMLYLDLEHNIPLKIEAESPAGPIVFRLTRAENSPLQ
jgi:hypothetical protein